MGTMRCPHFRVVSALVGFAIWLYLNAFRISFEVDVAFVVFEFYGYTIGMLVAIFRDEL